MKFDLQKPYNKAQSRRSIRLKGFDYSQPGAYFITIVTFQHQCVFGEIANQEMQLNPFGMIAEECLRAIPEHFTNVELGAHVVMPNHLHGIIVIHEDKSSTVGARHASPPPPRGVKPNSLGAIVGSFKSAVTKRTGRELNISNIWQRNYVSHVLCGITNM
jgi:putative transposase